MTEMTTSTTTESLNMTEASSSTAAVNPELGRNEPCPCGSGKKYKRCHGVDAAPKLSQPAAAPAQPGAGPATQAMAGFDPSKMDPAQMAQMSKALQRLPRGQLQKLQSIMQRAMAGQDVSREAMEFEKIMPPELKQMAMSMQMQAMAEKNASAVNEPKDENDAKRIIAEAVAAGKISAEQAKELLGGEDPQAILASQKSGISKLWGKITGKN